MTTLDNADIDRLRSGFSGEVLDPRHESYNMARTIFNAMIDRRPAVIAQCATIDDIQRSIRFARDRELEISVRGGGHGVSGKSLTEGGLVIDMRRMHEASVNRDAGTVTVQGGAMMTHLDRATEPFGLATTGGRVSSTGVAGYTLGGGDGWLARKMGLACDNLVAAQVVTADGTVVDASEKVNPELFWALHGGGGNFGVATSLTFRLHKLPVVTCAFMLWPSVSGPAVLRAYRDFLETAPDEVGGAALHCTCPSEEFVPKEMHGKLCFAILLAFAGPEDEAKRVAAPLMNLNHHGGFMMEMSNAEFQCMFDDPPGYRNYWSAEYLESLPDAAIDVCCARAYDMVVPSPSQNVLIPQGGAIARGPAEYPLPWRGAPWCAHPFGLWEREDQDAQGMKWCRDLRTDLQPWATGAVYLNFIGDEGEDRVVAGLGRENRERLAKVKAEYDPENVFRLNHNIRPG